MYIHTNMSIYLHTYPGTYKTNKTNPTKNFFYLFILVFLMFAQK